MINSLIEKPLLLEVLTSAMGAIGVLWVSQYFDLSIDNQEAIFLTQISVSIGLMSVSAIVVTLAATLSPKNQRMRAAVGQISGASFSSLGALLGGALVVLLLLGFSAELPRWLRYALEGFWIGTVLGSSIRIFVLGHRILVANLRQAE